MEKQKCQEQVYNNWHWFGCCNNAKYERKGRWYCGVHDPDRRHKQVTIRSAKWDKEWAEKSDRNERISLMDRILKDKTVDELREMAKVKESK